MKGADKQDVPFTHAHFIQCSSTHFCRSCMVCMTSSMVATHQGHIQWGGGRGCSKYCPLQNLAIRIKMVAPWISMRAGSGSSHFDSGCLPKGVVKPGKIQVAAALPRTLLEWTPVWGAPTCILITHSPIARPCPLKGDEALLLQSKWSESKWLLSKLALMWTGSCHCQGSDWNGHMISQDHMIWSSPVTRA